MVGVGVLSVSGAGVSRNCDELVGLLHSLCIGGDVTSNTTVLANGRIERGCRVRVVSEPIKENTRALWEAARAAPLGLTCAHVELETRETGCVFDVYRASACPAKDLSEGKEVW